MDDFELDDPDLTDEDKEAIKRGTEVSLTVRTAGWDIIKREILLYCSEYEELVLKSKSMEETYGGAKTLSGLKFVLSLVDEIINDGQQAIEKYRKQE